MDTHAALVELRGLLDGWRAVWNSRSRADGTGMQFSKQEQVECATQLERARNIVCDLISSGEVIDLRERVNDLETVIVAARASLSAVDR